MEDFFNFNWLLCLVQSWVDGVFGILNFVLGFIGIELPIPDVGCV